ncbi:MAG: site-specific DNA-methyltransferase [Prevotella sp.]|jgi:site-specific DNA-methyltransferase (adenine-specific)|nr:site-specific DNA-methyltransferase [Prevotella sp.]
MIIQPEIFGKITAYKANDLVILKQYPDNYFDWTVADPNYGIGVSKPSKKNNRVKQSNGTYLYTADSNYKHKDWDNDVPPKEYFDELFRVSKNQIIFGVNYFDDPRLVGGRIVWDKLNGESDQMGCEIAYCSVNNRTDVIYYMWRGMMQGIYCGRNIHKALVQQGNKALNEKRIHPTQKPTLIYKYFMLNYMKSGDKLLDSRGGSFSQAIAAHDLDFELTIIENDEEYYDKGTTWLKWHQRQQKIFR